MKKTFLLLALVCVLVLLAACGSKPAPTEPAPTEPTSSHDLQMLYQSGITAMGAGSAGPVPGLGHFGAESPVPRTGGNFVPAGQRRPLPRDRRAGRGRSA